METEQEMTEQKDLESNGREDRFTKTVEQYTTRIPNRKPRKPSFSSIGRA